MCLYLDDGLVCGESAEDVNGSLEIIRKDLHSAGSETMLHTRAINVKVVNSAVPLDWHVRKDRNEMFEIDYWLNRFEREMNLVRVRNC
ncbi:hypothetical protein ANCCAN_25660 [Ancylostoma caninum]|uniref:Uncharacterized protein n=1 Tax=Ancylostoma caninum TaxID=29170 RepID=A0A368FCN9_ANCCA|nr:hypothetical protein ANCCAN_25660 [Ancylostoma caninum]